MKPLVPISLVLILTACSTAPLHQPSTETQDRDLAVVVPPETQQRRQVIFTPVETITPQQETTITYADVWDRIRNNLVLERHTDLQAVKIKINWFRNNQDYLHRVAERATPYLYYIVEELERRNMPLDLALLPVIESAYQPFAYSRSHASGIWQFIPGTGRMYGLKQNWWYDGRRDIVAGTRAALDYLQKLSDQFDGDWQLALASYNAGENRIERAIRNNRRQNKDTDFFSLSLPRETRGYIPSLLAIAEIVSHPEKYDLVLSPIPNQPFFSIVDIGDQLDLATAASLTDLTIDDIYTLNPGFNYWATDPDGPHYLLVPTEREQQFIQGLSALPKEERVGWKRHVIRQGETLSHIADQYRTSITAIKQTNNLRSNLIRTGQSLMIPGSKQPGQFYTLSRDNRRFAGLKREGTGEKYIYTVRSGDSLWTIGRRYGVSVRDLTGWNGINSNSILRPGQKLSLWVPGSTPSNQTASTSGNANAEYSVNEEGHVHYTVQKGDSLWLISRQFGVSVNQLQEWNKLPNGKPLQPGQLLVLLNAPQLAANSGAG